MVSGERTMADATEVHLRQPAWLRPGYDLRHRQLNVSSQASRWRDTVATKLGIWFVQQVCKACGTDRPDVLQETKLSQRNRATLRIIQKSF